MISCGDCSEIIQYILSHLVKCISPLSLLSEDNKRLVIADYSHPAMEGTNVSFSCPPGLVLTGPSMSMCMGNGEWEPDPSQARCNGKEQMHLCDVFHVHTHILL